MLVYSLRNDKTATYDAPFCCDSDADAREFFKAMLIPSFNSASASVRSIIDDLSLYKLGEWNDADGDIDRLANIERICAARDLFNA